MVWQEHRATAGESKSRELFIVIFSLWFAANTPSGYIAIILTANPLNLLRRTGVMLACLALLLQVLTLPMASRHQLASALWESGATLIEICTVHGLQSIKVGADGQKAPQDTALACPHCTLCSAAAMGFMPLAALGLVIPLFATARPALANTLLLPAKLQHLWPPATAPPAAR
jgi:hypothetical protein